MLSIVNKITIKYIIEEAITSEIEEILIIRSSTNVTILGRYIVISQIFKVLTMKKTRKYGEI